MSCDVRNAAGTARCARNLSAAGIRVPGRGRGGARIFFCGRPRWDAYAGLWASCTAWRPADTGCERYKASRIVPEMSEGITSLRVSL